MAATKGIMSSRILFGHLLGFGFRHSSNGFGLALEPPSDKHRLGPAICLELKKLGCRVRRGAQLWGSSRARTRRAEGRNGGMAEAIAAEGCYDGSIEVGGGAESLFEGQPSLHNLGKGREKCCRITSWSAHAGTNRTEGRWRKACKQLRLIT